MQVGPTLEGGQFMRERGFSVGELRAIVVLFWNGKSRVLQCPWGNLVHKEKQSHEIRHLWNEITFEIPNQTHANHAS